MFLHVAESASKERGQTKLLQELRYRSTLFSYAYTKQEQHFAPYWDAMHMHLAGIAAINPASVYPDVHKRLDSYAYPDEAERYMHHHFAGHPTLTGGQVRTEQVYAEPGMGKRLETAAYPERAETSALALDQRSAALKAQGCRVLIDSGAFTAFTLGKAVRVEQYAEWALSFQRRWGAKLAWLRFFNLDVIGDQAASWRNQATLERLGLAPVPIITHGAELAHLQRALDGYDYFALGGLVPLSRQRKKLAAWLDRCFSLVVAKFRRTGVMPRVHLLGVSQEWILQSYPAYSADSSSWVAVLRYGGTTALGKSGPSHVPHAKHQPAINVYALRQEIRRYQEMERQATATWAQRGVRWDD